MIQLTAEEFQEAKRFRMINMDPESSNVVEVDPEKSYLLFADESVCIDDVKASAERLNLKIGLVRVSKEG